MSVRNSMRVVLWLTGLPGAGKTTLGRAVQERLTSVGSNALLLDGDELRGGVCADLGFSPVDRHENIRRAGELARRLFNQGHVVICAFVSPYRDDRARVRALFPAGAFLEVFVKAGVETCRARDPKGLYAGAGSQNDLTGVSAPYEEPLAPDLVVDTACSSVAQGAGCVLACLARTWPRRGGRLGTTAFPDVWSADLVT